MAVATFKSEFPQNCQNCKHCDRDNFEEEIKNTIITQVISPKHFFAFKSIVLEAVTLYSTLRTKYLWANHSSCLNEYLGKAIMHKSKLRNNS